MKTLLLIPTAREARALRSEKALICGAGPGAYIAAKQLIADAKPDLVVLAGVCGALDPSMKAGGVILSRHVIAPGHDVIEPDRLLLDEIRTALRGHHESFVFSRLLTVDQPIAGRDAKRDAWNEYGAGGVDMETFHVARAAQEASVRWLALRAVVDTASQSLPASLAAWSEDGDERGGLRAALLRPREWPAYARLARQFPRAMAALRTATPLVVRAAKAAKNVETLPMVEVIQK
jgi:adenosylhomocysteine nucleosidase